MTMRRIILFCMVVASILIVAFQTTSYAQETKPVLSSLNDLPKRTYSLPSTVDVLLTSPEKIRLFAASLRKDLEADLEQYVFANSVVERKFYSQLLQVDLAMKNLDESLVDIHAIRRLSDTEALKRMAVLHAEAWVRAQQAIGPEASLEALREAYSKYLQKAVNTLPRVVVYGELTKRRFKMELATEDMIRMMLANIKAGVSEEGMIDAEMAQSLIGLCNAFHIILPFKDITIEIYSDFLKNDGQSKTPIMTENQVSLTSTDSGQPVNIAIWDTGVDTHVFKDRIFVNPRECADGRDTDGNGFIDDLHGIAFSDDMKPSTELLKPQDMDAQTMEKARKLLKGLEDLRTGDDSPEAEAFLKLGAGISDEEKSKLENLMYAYDFYCHGTHVAGIATASNPFARILVARVAIDEESLKTEAWARGFVAMCQETVDYFKANGVRVANMSWGWDVHEIEANLTAHGFGRDADERVVMARDIFSILEEGLHKILADAPDILFVNGAGEAPGDPAKYRWIPGVFDLPNVIPVGAVDAYGEITTFTAHGSHVRLLADGFHVDSFVPGGTRMKLSGTSMAAPQVTNLAAKLLALEPSLTPKEVIALMIEGGNQVERGGRSQILLNPLQSMKLLKAQ